MDVELRHTRTIVYRCRVFQQAMIDYQRVYVSPSGGSITNLAELQKTGWWLSHPSEKYEFVSWDDEIPYIYIYGKIKFMFQNHQIDKLQPENSWLFFSADNSGNSPSQWWPNSPLQPSHGHPPRPIFSWAEFAHVGWYCALHTSVVPHALPCAHQCLPTKMRVAAIQRWFRWKRYGLYHQEHISWWFKQSGWLS